MNNTNYYTNGGVFRPLLLCPSPGLNEKQHRRFSSANEMSYQLRRYLDTETDTYSPYDFPSTPSPAPSQTQFLMQDLYIQSQKVDGCGSRSKRSYRSKSSGRGGGSGEDRGMGLGVDMICGMGAWDEGFERGEYALAISGLTEFIDEE